MTDNPDLDRIRDTVAKFTDLDPATFVGTMHLGYDLNLDSLEVVQVLIELEDEFEIELVDETIGMNTLGEIAGVVAIQLEKKHG